MVHEKINYLEIPAKDMDKTKQFFHQVFGWQFTNYGPEYSAFGKEAGLDGGFYLSDNHSSTANGACLVVFYSAELDKTMAKITQNGGQIVKATFEFPGGRRFHFADPNGNEFAVWSDN